jgi:hypothetical protein
MQDAQRITESSAVVEPRITPCYVRASLWIASRNNSSQPDGIGYLLGRSTQSAILSQATSVRLSNVSMRPEELQLPMDYDFEKTPAPRFRTLSAKVPTLRSLRLRKRSADSRNAVQACDLADRMREICP